MVSFDEIKSIPKIDLHMNLLSSITTNLAFDLNEDLSFAEVIEMQDVKFYEYEKGLELPIKLLNSNKNIVLAIKDLINRLRKNNVIYGELFIDLPIYNHNVSLDRLINKIIETIKEEDYNLQLVLCVSDKLSKEENNNVLLLLDKYYGNGVNGVYFKKDKSTNIFDYIYIFDKLMRNNIPYIVPFDSKLTNQNREIYLKASRIEYLLDEENQELLDLVQENKIYLEFSISKSIINNSNIYSLIYRLIKDNYLVSINSLDMTLLNTDIINEYCLLFNNTEISLLELVKLLINNIDKLKIDNNIKEKLLIELRKKSNEIL